ncbi:MAG TPA: putative Ig domain-containing protein [Holophagaceae bacterium]|nr:putative Ig domain-containing protein [Holophagaceae bacterium]
MHPATPLTRSAALASALGLLALGLACSTPAKDKVENLQPAISSLKAATANTPAAWNAAVDQAPVNLTSGGTIYLKGTFASAGGSALITPGNLPAETGQPLAVGPLTTTTTFTLTVTDAQGHHASRNVTVNVVATPDATITAPAAAITGTTGLQASVANVAGSTYLWELTNGTITAGATGPVVTFTAGSAGAAGAAGSLQLKCTVKNAAGTSAIGNGSMVVNANPPGTLSYGTANLTAYASVPLTPLTATVTGGDPVQAFTVNPGLPAGLTLDPATGRISGTPTAATAANTYHVAATNSGGSATFDLHLTVAAQPSASFSAASPTIGLGGGTVLNWTVDASVASITVDNGVQSTPLDTTSVRSGAFPVSPTTSTTYTLTATLVGGGTFSPAPATVTVDATPFAINTFTTTAVNNVVPYGSNANLAWTLSGVPVTLTLNGNSVLGNLSASPVPVRRQTFTLAGANGLTSEHTDSKSLTLAAQGLDLVAGHYSGPGYRDAQGASAQFNGPFAVARDAAGNLYIADTLSHVIRMMDPAGNVTTIAGVVGTPGTADGSLGTALFNAPRGIAAHADGSVLYVADYNSHSIRKLVKSGNAWTVSTLAGTPGTFGANDGAPGVAQFDNPSGLALDSTTTPQYLYVADYYIGLIRQVDVATGNTITYAGSAFGHVDVSNTFLGSAKFDNPAALAFGTVGGQPVLFVMDYYINCLRAVTYNGPATVKATTTSGMTGSVFSIAGPASGITSNTFGYADGTGTAAKFNNPTGLVVDASGSTVYIADSGNNCIRRVDVPTLANAAGVVTTVAGSTTAGGSDAATGTSAGFKTPQGLLLAGSSLVVTDAGNGTIRSVDTAAAYATSTLAGTPRVLGYLNGTGAAVKLNAPVGVAVDATGNAYVADTANHVIRKVAVDGTTTLVAGTPGTSGAVDTAGGTPSFKSPQGITVDKATGVIYVADTGNKSIRKIATDGTVTTLVAAGLNNPYGLALDPSGTNYLWITDGSNKVLPLNLGTNTLGTAVGTGTAGYVDGAAGTARFRFNGFSGIVADAAGNLYVADRGNNCIRKLTKGSSYAVSTFTGIATATLPATPYGFVDGAVGTAKLNTPQGLDIDATGNLYVADASNHAIRKVDTAGTVSTLVGQGSTLYNANGAPIRVGVSLGALPAGLIAPQSLALTPTGDLVVITNDALLQVTAPNGQ